MQCGAREFQSRADDAAEVLSACQNPVHRERRACADDQMRVCRTDALCAQDLRVAVAAHLHFVVAELQQRVCGSRANTPNGSIRPQLCAQRADVLIQSGAGHVADADFEGFAVVLRLV